jgi:hemolysin activation/secretion protein
VKYLRNLPGDLTRVSRDAGRNGRGLIAGMLAMSLSGAAISAAVGAGATNDVASSAVDLPASARPPARSLYVAEYRVIGAQLLSEREIGEAVYPYLGPARTEGDLLRAAEALEKVYKEKGYQTVSVSLPEQTGRRGIVFLQVTEARVGRLRVHGSRYFALDKIKAKVPSLAEGKVPNFHDVGREIVALNQSADRRVTPELRPGVEPGTVDIDLNVKDTLPLHGSVEVNNRYSADTKPLRVSGSISYSNLWQLGHAAGASFQVSPQDLEQVKVFSGYYIARFASVDWLSVIVQGVKQNSNVSTLGSVAVAGRGEVIGTRALISLPPRKDFYHSTSFGIDYKHFEQEVGLGVTGAGTTAGMTTTTPISYYPLSIAYTATWIGKSYTTDVNAGVNFHLRGMGSESPQFDENRFNADGNYIYVRGDLSHTQKLPRGAELFAKVQGQLAGQPLVSSEQFGGGGLGTVRGYLEAEVLGDNAGFGTIELRSPSLLGWWGRKDSEWQIYAFAEGGLLSIHDPLPEQESSFRLASVGIGSRVRLLDHLNGSIDLALPLISQTQTQAHEPFVSFRVWADF